MEKEIREFTVEEYLALPDDQIDPNLKKGYLYARPIWKNKVLNQVEEHVPYMEVVEITPDIKIEMKLGHIKK